MLIGHSPELRVEVGELQHFLHERFYRHPRLQQLTEHAARVLSPLFEAYVESPAEMPAWYQLWIDIVGRERAVCDYLAGMTDRFAEREFERLIG